MNITRLNFKEIIPILLKNVSEANFVAMDFQMSGIESSAIFDPSLTDSIQTRYHKTKCRIQRFIPLQLGLCTVKIQPNKIIYSPFNIYLYPLTLSSEDSQQFTFNCQSMRFLAKNNFNFNKFFYEGVPFVSPKRIERHGIKREQLKKRQQETKQYILNSPSVAFFINAKFNEVANWISQMNALSSEEQKDVKKREFLIDIQFVGIRAYESLMYQMQKTYPSLNIKFEYLDKNKQPLVDKKKFLSRKYLKITKLTPQQVQKKQESQSKEQKFEQEPLESLQFNQIWETIQANKTPLLVHNGFLDIMHLYYRFIDDLPPAEERYRSFVNRQFPLIYDTKYICNSSPLIFTKTNQITSLSSCYKFFRKLELQSEQPTEDQELASDRELFSKRKEQNLASAISQECTQYEFDKEGSHEAGFDALMTAYTFVNAMKLMHHKPSRMTTSEFILNSQYYCNKIPLGSIRIPYNLKETSDTYTKDATKQFYFTCLETKESVESSQTFLAKQVEISKQFEKKFGPVRILWLSKHLYNFVLTFIRPQDESKFSKLLDDQGYLLYKVQKQTKFLVSTRTIPKQLLIARTAKDIRN